MGEENSTESIPVNMRLTRKAVQAAENITARHCTRNRATATTHALVLTDFITQKTKCCGARLVLVYPNGTTDKIVYLELGLK